MQTNNNQPSLEVLRESRVYPFTHSECFNLWLENTFQDIRERAQVDSNKHGEDFKEEGLYSLVAGCYRKARVLYYLIIKGFKGGDKVEDEFMDNLMFAVYSYIYYKKIDEKEKLNGYFSGEDTDLVTGSRE